jgi:hypothetical protein
MMKYFLVLSLLVANHAFSQVSSGTIIAFNFTKNELVVAADSLAVNQDTGAPDYCHCKIAAFSSQLVFTTVGSSSFAHGDTILWDNIELAKEAVRAAPRKESGGLDVDAIANYWAQTVKGRWNLVNRSQAENIAAANSGQITAGVFIGRGVEIKIALVGFDASNLPDPIQYKTGDAISACWPCGQEAGEQLCVAGIHADVAAKFCSQRKSGAKISVKTRLKRPDKTARLATKIVELTNATYEKTAKDVGGRIDVIAMTKDGRIRWLARKSNCPENQD